MLSEKTKGIIVALDLHGGFAKEGKIPWDFPEDFRYFQYRTKNHVCVMGRRTYDDMVKIKKDRQGEAYDEGQPVLTNRESFVVTSRPDTVVGATGITNWWDIDTKLEYDQSKIVWFIGGERIYRETIPIVNVVLTTIINDVYDCDQHFPTKYLLKNFTPQDITQQILSDPANANMSNDKLRYIAWQRS